MKWMDMLWTAYDVALDTTITCAADTLNGMGSLACLIGGGTFALSYSLEEALTINYYASLNTTGTINVTVVPQKADYTVTAQIPFQYFAEHDRGNFTSNLSNYINPETLRTTSAIFATSGTILRFMGANIKLWQQNRTDKKLINKLGLDEDKFTEFSKPGLNEYLFASAESFLNSVNLSMLGCSISAAVIELTGLNSSSMRITLPVHGADQVNSTYYQGPVFSTMVPAKFTIHENVTVQLPDLHLNIATQDNAQTGAEGNLSLGAAILLQPPADSEPLISVPAIISVGTYLASTFFGKKSEQARNERILEHKPTSYHLI